MGKTRAPKQRKRALLLASLVMLISLSGCAASGTCGGGNIVNIAGMGSWQALTGIALVMSFSVIGLGYMAGEFLRSAAMVAWARQELVQVLVSVVLAASVVIVADRLCAMSVSEFIPLADANSVVRMGAGGIGITNSDNYFGAAEKYLVWMRGAAFNWYMDIRNKIGGMEKDASSSRYVCSLMCWIGMQGYSVDEYVGYYTAIGVLMQYMSTITIAMLSILFMLHVLAYMKIGMFNVLLPIGIVFRSLPFMRGFGGALIAMVLAMFFFYPMMLVLNAFVWAPIAASAFAGVSGGLSRYFEASAVLFIGAVFLPALNFVVIIAGARELSRILGEEMDISRLAQMV